MKILTTGQFIEALESGKYDLNKTALIITQTGGGCRATNYIAFIRKALKDMGLSHIPVISLSASTASSTPTRMIVRFAGSSVVSRSWS